ncbi:MAG: CDP-diacylglycerol--glycerol-3-phosphate 3-phosphatidyltransferase [bacterium]
MNLANRITLLRIVLIPFVLVLLLLGLNGLAAGFFLLLSLSDALDGYIARKYNQVSELGKFLDPLADKVLVISVLIILVGLGKADSIAVLILVVRELLVQGIRINTAKSGKIVAAAPLAKWKTVVQITATTMLILSLPFAAWLLWFAIILALISGWGYLWQSKIINQLKLS